MKTLIFLAALALSACGKLGSTDAKLDPSSPYYDELNLFVSEARSRGLELESQVASIPIQFVPLSGTEEGRCEKSLIGGRRILINETFWIGATKFDRLSVLFHELGHCVLNREHRNGVGFDASPLSVMNSFAPVGEAFRFHEKYYLDELFHPENFSF